VLLCRSPPSVSSLIGCLDWKVENCYRTIELAVSNGNFNSEFHWSCVIISHRTTRRMYHSRNRSTTLCMNILVRLVIQTARGLTRQHTSIGIV
jgi:phosphopantetheinyl transferase